MLRFFRLILLILSLAVIVLSAFAFTGSYKNEAYLTKTYLIDFQLNNLDLSKLITVSDLNKIISGNVKRSIDLQQPSVSVDLKERTSADDVSSSVSSIVSQASSVIDEILDLKYSDLGLADVYSASFWGYCKGNVTSEKKQSSNEVLKEFDNNKLNFTWCSKPKAGYFFDPLTIFKEEVGDAINGTVTGGISDPDLSDTVKSALAEVLDKLNYDSFNLPGNLNDKLKVLNGVTKAGFALILVTIILGFICLVMQTFACCLSPDSCCLSFLNFSLQFITFLAALVGAALITGAYVYTRKEINDNVSSYGVKSYLSINFYAFIWSAVVAAFLVIVISALGHCCGLFGVEKRSFKPYRQVSGGEPNMGYDHYLYEKLV
ncbi:uncharacterized protein PRCAT00004629001 [Priceomyces carsonii]|uniref:uncharacterized protein n=1 Tax=Priceomyces carsonii TaxID=28549 RepID=UPI002EDA22E6|nr:unnamed protein product [Priceomyces carsonii]